MSGEALMTVVLRGDDDDVEIAALIEFDSGESPTGDAIRLTRSVAGSLAGMAPEAQLDEACAAVEHWCHDEGVVPLTHRRSLAAALGMSSADSRRTSAPAVRMLGTPPLMFPAKGSADDRGRRTDAELPPPPAPESLSEIGRQAQDVLRLMVQRAGGRMAGAKKRITPDNLGILSDLMYEWAAHYGVRQAGGLRFSPHDEGSWGGWYTFDRLVPLQDPNRWDPLRLAVYRHLESHRGWTRESKSAPWWIPDAANVDER